MDAITRNEIMAAVKTAVSQAVDTLDEKWLSGMEVCEQFQMFTPSWIKRYGHLLPRIQAVVKDENGVEHRTGWAYGRNRIQRMIDNDQLRFSECQVSTR
jgi:hypothetical protein